MSIESIILIYTVLTLGGVSFLAWYSARRARRFAPLQSEDSIFRCPDCGAVYTDDADVDLSRCPQCGRMNDPISF
jgi:rubrerythrin